MRFKKSRDVENKMCMIIYVYIYGDKRFQKGTSTKKKKNQTSL